MKKIKGLLLSVLALGCVAMASCSPKGEDKYTVTLMYNGEVISTMEKGKATHLDAPAAPAKEGYTFVGWYVDEALTVPYTPDLLSAHLTLYAKYEANTYYITFNLNGGTLDVNKVEVKNGEAYTLPTPTKDGYTFAGWTLDGEDFPANGTYARTSSVKVSASWTKNKYTVTFTDGENTLGTVENVEHGTKVQAWNSPAPGYEVVGIYTDAEMTTEYDFDTPVTGALTLYVKTQAKTFNIIVNADGDTQLDTTAVYNGTYALPAAPTREGYFFQGYTLNDQAFAATGTYTWTTDIVVNATWERDPAFGKSTVFFYDGTVEIASLRKVVDDGSALTDLAQAPDKAGYTFNGWYTDSALTTAFVDGTVVNDDMNLYAKYTANEYVLHLNLDGGTVDGETSIDVVYGEAYSLPTPVKNGYKFEGYKYNNNAFAASGTYNYATDITVFAVWTRLDADADENSGETFLVKDNYFKEREDTDDAFTYVFVTGKDYTFNGTTSVTALGAGDAVTQNSAIKFTANKAATFTLEVTKVVEGTSITYTRSAKIVDQVTTFDGGASYSTAWGAGVANRAANFMETKADAVMAVGASNFVPEIAVGTLNSQALTQAQAHMQLTAKVNGAQTTAFTYANGVVTFDSALVGETVELTFAPKYSLTNAKLVMNVKVNNGTNVYTSAELYRAYKESSVREINILRNIKAEFDASALSAESGYTGPKNGYTYGVYVRNVAPGDSIVVNGNFFKIDGSELPLVDNRYDDDTKSALVKDAMYASNTQIGIFSYYCHILDESTGVSVMYSWNDGTAVFNDLFVTGNYTKAADYTEQIDGLPTYTQSGSLNGIVIRGGKVTANNLTVTNTNTAMFTGSNHRWACNGQYPVQLTMNSVKFVHSWSSHFYLYNFTTLDLTTSYFGDTSGPIIVVDDIGTSTAITSIYTTINVDRATKFDNWVTGEEAYYTIRGMGTLPVTMKGMVDDGVKNATHNQATAIKKIGGADCMNIILLVKSQKSETSDWAVDAQGKPYVADNFAQIGVAGMPTGTPGEDQLFVAFSNAVMNPNAKNYLCGYMEVLKA